MKQTPIFHAVVRNGKLIITNRKSFDSHIASLNGECSVEIIQWTNRRSLDQNALIWFTYTVISEDTGYTPEEVHELSKRMCLDPQFIEWKGKTIKIPGSTAKMGKEEVDQYLDRVCALWEIARPNLDIK